MRSSNSLARSRGEIDRGYFNLMQPKGLHGHLRHERCAAVASSSVRSWARVGLRRLHQRRCGIMFKVFVGRDETRALRGDQLKRFSALQTVLLRQGGLAIGPMSREVPCSRT